MGVGKWAGRRVKRLLHNNFQVKKLFFIVIIWYCVVLYRWWWWWFSSVFPAREAPTALLRLLRWKLWISYRRWRVAECILGWQYGVHYFLCSEIVVVVEKKERVPSIWATRNLFIWAVESFNDFTILVANASRGGLGIGIVSKDL